MTLKHCSMLSRNPKPSVISVSPPNILPYASTSSVTTEHSQSKKHIHFPKTALVFFPVSLFGRTILLVISQIPSSLYS